MNLRPYQVDTLARVRACFAKGASRVLIVAPTGAGKTVMLGEICRSAVAKKRRVAVFAHRKELVMQAAATFRRFGLDVGYGGESRSAPVQIATVQGALAGEAYPPADIVILDEAHHYCADEWAELPKRYESACIIGATATPERGDLRGLDGLFEEMVVSTSIAELQKLGVLVPLDIRRPSRHLRPDQIAQYPHEAYRDHTSGTRAVVFAQTVKQAREYCGLFVSWGIPAACVFGETGSDEREATLRRFASGEVMVLCNVAVLTEGWDCPPASTCILARGCGSFGMLVQMVGRVLRASEGKTGATLLDLRGVTYALGRPDAEAEYSLAGIGMQCKSSASGPRFCPVCSLPLGNALTCPECGKATVGEKQMKVTGDKLTYWKDELQKDPPSTRLSRLTKWVAEAKERGHKATAASFKFRAVYGHFPISADTMAADLATKHVKALPKPANDTRLRRTGRQGRSA